jgi:hypothetical protein
MAAAGAVFFLALHIFNNADMDALGILLVAFLFPVCLAMVVVSVFEDKEILWGRKGRDD